MTRVTDSLVAECLEDLLARRVALAVQEHPARLDLVDMAALVGYHAERVGEALVVSVGGVELYRVDREQLLRDAQEEAVRIARGRVS